MSISTSRFHQEKEALELKKQKIYHGSAAEGVDTKNLKTHTCDNCGIIGVHLTKDCPSGRYGRIRKYERNTIRFQNLPSGILNRDLKWLCDEYGPVVRVAGPEIKVFGDQGLVSFENREDAQMAIVKLNGSTYKGCVITVGWSRSEPDLNSCKHCSNTDSDPNLIACRHSLKTESDSDLIAQKRLGKYVHNAIRLRYDYLRGEAKMSDIATLCRNFGSVVDIFEPGLYYAGRENLSLLVAFENKEDAVKAAHKLHGTVFMGRPIAVEWPIIFKGRPLAVGCP